MTDSLFTADAPQHGPIECLGLTFDTDDARRDYFLDLLRRKLQDSEFRKIEGFPIGTDEDILALSDPPYYTACPNPFLEEFIRCHGTPYDPETDDYHREPFAVDVSEGKTDPIYTAHGYHTKVPHKAIMPAILHYTRPGDLVLDGFCGSGMTGVAAQMCGSPDPEFKRKLEAEWEAAGRGKPVWGARRAILNDLSPAATFIAANYNLPFDVDAFEREARRILAELEAEIGWMYETPHTDGKTKGRINYTVWSEVFACPECGGEIVFLNEALDRATGRVRDSFPCPGCDADLVKDRLHRRFETLRDPATGEPWKRIRLMPVFINYSIGKDRHEKALDPADLEVLRRIEALPLPAAVPTNPLPIAKMYHGSRLAPKGFTHVHHFYLPRAAQALGRLWARSESIDDRRTRELALYLSEQAIWGLSLLARYVPTHYSQVNQYLTGVYYVGSQHAECTPWYVLAGKIRRLHRAFTEYPANAGSAHIGTGSASTLEAVASFAEYADYIFTDPPFGENIYYADLNYLVESWHRVWTDAGPEAIIDQAKKKTLADYQNLMERCFREYHRVLKPGRWMTMVFHNSRNSVWNAIQEALTVSGFVVADVRTIDKQQGSYRQVTSTAAKQDLVISAYKPNGGLEERFKLEAGTDEGAWDFVRTHLRQLPVFVQAKGGAVEVLQERMAFMLYDRMVAFHVQRGITVPLSAPEFYAGLAQRFSERDGMFFLPDQTAEYDRRRLSVREVLQLQLLVTDEASAIQWLAQQLTRKPQTFQELHPQFLRELGGWQKHETPLELSAILEQNFLRYPTSPPHAGGAGGGPIPAQIVSWMKQSDRLRTKVLEAGGGEGREEKGERREDKSEGQGAREEGQPVGGSRVPGAHGLATTDPEPLAAARDRWYVPDPNRAIDLERLRERALLKEFEEYRASGQRRLKVFRLEAVRAGFKRAWQERDYAAIIQVASKVPEDVLQEDPKLLMWVDQATTRVGGGG